MRSFRYSSVTVKITMTSSTASRVWDLNNKCHATRRGCPAEKKQPPEPDFHWDWRQSRDRKRNSESSDTEGSSQQVEDEKEEDKYLWHDGYVKGEGGGGGHEKRQTRLPKGDFGASCLLCSDKKESRVFIVGGEGQDNLKKEDASEQWRITWAQIWTSSSHRRTEAVHKNRKRPSRRAWRCTESLKEDENISDDQRWTSSLWNNEDVHKVWRFEAQKMEMN